MHTWFLFFKRVNKKIGITFLLLLAIPVILIGCGSNEPGTPNKQIRGLRFVTDIPLGNNGARFDYMSLDDEKNKLYIAHMGADQIIVFDTKKQKVISTLTNVSDVHGVLAVPMLKKIYATATGENMAIGIDEQSLQKTMSVPAGDYPDAIEYDPDDNKIFISDESGRTLTVINVQTNKKETSIPLGGEVGNNQYDPASHLIYVTVKKSKLVAIDPKMNQVVGRYDLPGCDGPHGLNIDSPSRIAFVACEDNAKLVTFDLNNMKPLSLQSVGDVPDVLAFDPGLHRLYVAAESGVLAIFEERKTGTKVNTVKLSQDFVAPEAHTIAVNTKTHQIYFPLESQSGHPVLRTYKPE